ncbi:MAG: CBS domain-containing protein [Phycisphaerales bacterium]|nr:CBS domain-containing protein [Phycisphaerales bacterium]MCB9855715.1 CBS domain-containing protein [Phycisphaerales bacterium]MCB9862610.1 CBS domain-containing protein [Phycisphaerales bacterium]
MQLNNFIKSKVMTVAPGDSLDKAIAMMEEHQIHHLPVVDDGRPVGMVSDRDLLIAVGWKLEVERSLDGRRRKVIGPRRVREIMAQPVVTIDPDAEVHTAARAMAEGRFHAIPLVRRNLIVGVVTCSDLLSLYSSEGSPLALDPRLDEPVATRMHANVQTIGPKEPLHAASKMFHDLRIRHLPVASDGILMGLVSDRDVRRECGADAIEDEKAQANGGYYIGATTIIDIMTRDVETAPETLSLREAMRTMVSNEIGCLPVVRADTLVGIITETDLLRLVAMIDDDACASGKSV